MGKISVPVGLHFKSFTDDIPVETKTNIGEKYLDSGHMNAFLLLPPMTTILNAKLQNKPLRSMVNNKDNAKIISYIRRFQYWTKAVTNNKVHPALNLYSPSSGAEFKKDFFHQFFIGELLSCTSYNFLSYHVQCLHVIPNSQQNKFVDTYIAEIRYDRKSQ